MPQTNLQLMISAQQSAQKAVADGADPFATIQACVADFAATGNPGTDWPKFKGAYDRASSEYKNALNADRTTAAKGVPAGIPTALATVLAKTAQAAAAAPAAPAAGSASTPPVKSP